MSIKLFPAKTGKMIAEMSYWDELIHREKKILLASKFDPEQEAARWAEDVYDETQEAYMIYGLGFGYHIKALAERIKDTQNIYVIETNIELHNQLKSHIDKEMLQSPQVHLLITDSIVKISEFLDGLKGIKIKVVIHETLLKTLPPKQQLLKQTLENYQFRYQTVMGGKHSSLVRENYTYYLEREYVNVEEFYGKHKDKPLIIVAGGPSLEKNLQVLKEVDDKVFIFAVGRVLNLLLNQQIRPNMFAMIDPHHELMKEQIIGIEKETIPMTFLNTASYQAVESYKGPKYIAYSMDSEVGTRGRIETGGSVATAILDLAIRFGANPILFIGQDLAYTNQFSHVRETANSHQIDGTKEYIKVKGINGEYLETNRAMLSFKYFIEDKIRQNPDLTFYNCTEGGAYIQGCIHQKLYETLVGLKCLKK